MQLSLQIRAPVQQQPQYLDVHSNSGRHEIRGIAKLSPGIRISPCVEQQSHRFNPRLRADLNGNI